MIDRSIILTALLFIAANHVEFVKASVRTERDLKKGGKGGKGKGDGGSSSGGSWCGPSAVKGKLEYESQGSGTTYIDKIYCNDYGKCQLTESSPTDACVVVALFDAYDFKYKHGECRLGHDRDNSDFDIDMFTDGFPKENWADVDPRDGYIPLLGLSESPGPCDTADFAGVSSGEYGFKAIIKPDGCWEFLFTDDGGETFYNEGTPRLAIKTA